MGKTLGGTLVVLDVLVRAEVADQVGVVVRSMAWRLRAGTADLEGLARLVALDEQNLVERPPPRRADVIGGPTVALACEVLIALGADLRIVPYDVAPGRDAADKLKLLLHRHPAHDRWRHV